MKRLNLIVMGKMEVVPPPSPKELRLTVRDLEMGQFAKVGLQPEFLVIRTREGATFLSDGSGSDITLSYEVIEILPPGTVIKLKIGE